MTSAAEIPGPAARVPAALDVSGLSAGYGSTTVLRDVSVSVPAGSVAALVGPNGAGKSTLLRAIAGIITPTAGNIRFNGADITSTPAYVRSQRGLCLIPEGRAIYRSLSVKDNLLLQASREMQREAVDRACSVFPALGRRLTQRASTLSGGEQQMLALCAAYIRNPAVVMVDEASQGLAPIVVDKIFEFLAGIAHERSSLLIVDQYVTKALNMASHAYVLRQGRIVFSGAPSTLLEGDVFDHYVGA
jgi:branched-chain amino acid transport system ATP-binding protein